MFLSSRRYCKSFSRTELTLGTQPRPGLAWPGRRGSRWPGGPPPRNSPSGLHVGSPLDCSPFPPPHFFAGFENSKLKFLPAEQKGLRDKEQR